MSRMRDDQPNNNYSANGSWRLSLAKSQTPRKMFQIWQIEWVSEGEGEVGRRDDGGAGAPHSHQIPLGEIDIFLQLYFSRISLTLK